MINPDEIIAARDCGEIRYAVVYSYTADLSQVLGKFGLRPDASLLVECNRNAAHQILAALLWKDMAYQVECMPKSTAEGMATEILSQHAKPESKYFTNKTDVDAWNDMTESTFDCGLVITNDVTHRHFCVWFEDED